MDTAHHDSSFTDDVAKFYESTLVPLIFEPYARDLARRARVLAPSSVLEVACGPGVVSRALATALPGSCSITSTDLNEAMVGHAESIGAARSVTWRQADVMALPFAADSFDVVVCQFGVMFFPDRAAGYREIKRVLRPGGTFLFNVWNRIEDNEFAHVVTEAMRARYPTDPPVFLARTPHGYSVPERIGADASAAGFANSEFDQRDEVSVAASADVVAIAYCHGTPLRNEIEAREPGGLDRATRAAAQALGRRFGDGSIEGRISAVIATCR